MSRTAPQRAVNAALVAAAALTVAIPGCAAAHAATTLLMAGTQSCLLTTTACVPESVPTPAWDAQIPILDPALAGNTLVNVPTPEQLWPVTGLRTETLQASVAGGVANLNTAILTTPGPRTVVGISQSAIIIAGEQALLMTEAGAPPPAELSFVAFADPVSPNGGFLTRFPWLQNIPVLRLGPTAAPPDTAYDTTIVNREYDGFSDFPQYPRNLLADANAVAGIAYLHGSPVPINPAVDQITSVTDSAGGTTTYVLVPTPTLPLLTPLQKIGVSPSVIARLNAVLKPLVDAGYDRSVSPGVTTPAQPQPSRAAIGAARRSVGPSATHPGSPQSAGSRGRR